MSYADPQSVTINSVATSLPRNGASLDQGIFRSADGLVELKVTHTNGRRNRHEIRLSLTKTAADSLIPSQNVVLSMSTYLVVDVPKNGFSVAEQKYLVDALSGYLAASSGAKVTQLLGGES